MQHLYTEHALRKVCEPAPLWQVTAPVKTLGLVPGSVPAGDAPTVYEKPVTCAGTVRFVFGGSDGSIRVCLDGELLGESTAGHPFDAYRQDLPYQTHLLKMELGAGAKTVAPVTLEQLGSALISDMKTEVTRQGKTFLVRLTVKVRSLADEEQTVQVEAKVGDAAMHWKKRVLAPGEEILLTGTLPLPGSKAWATDHPEQVTAEAVLWCDGEPIDDLRTRLCLRTVETVENNLIVNGTEQPMHAVTMEQGLTLDAACSLLRNAKQQGCNGVHGVGHDLRCRDLCDQLGLIVLD